MRTSGVVLSLIVLAGCGGGGAPATKEPVPVVPDARPAEEVVEDPVEVPDPNADALARVPEIRAKVSELRGLPSTDVAASIQTVADFEVFVREQTAKEVSAEEAISLSRAMATLGVLETQVDLLEVSIGTAVTQVAAYYNPSTKDFKIVQVPKDAGEFDMVSAHELTHAIQDQNFDLKAFMPEGQPEDEANARRFLVEGEASLLMFLYLASSTGEDPFNPVILTVLRKQIGMMALVSASDIAAMMAKDPAMAAAMDIPPYVMVPMFDSYMKGAHAVLLRYLEGGWPAVDELYKTPPSSTEQVLHPAQKLVCRREEPIEVKLPATTAGKGWTSVSEGTLGELLFRVYGQVWKLGDLEAFADGWGGDHWQVVEQGDATMGMLATAWDSADDAKQFADGMRASFKTRAIAADLRESGSRVDVVMGCEAKACKKVLDAMGKLHKKAKPAKPVKPTTAETDCLARLGA